MANFLAFTTHMPARTLERGENLTEIGDFSGELYVLEQGRLSVERDGVIIATLAEPGAVIGEMSVLLGKPHTATVRAADATTVRVVEDALGFLERNPLAALHVATMACQRLDATSALVVSQKHELDQRPSPGLVSRLLSSLAGGYPQS